MRIQAKLQPNKHLYLFFGVFSSEKLSLSPSDKIDYDATDLFFELSVIIEEYLLASALVWRGLGGYY